MFIPSLLAFSALPITILDLVHTRSVHALPEDPAAFPKYKVSYLNGLPVQKSTAEGWLKDGLHGGEAEFMEQPWNEAETHHGERREISDAQHVLGSPPSMNDYRLESMKLGPKLDFLCLIPPPMIPVLRSEDEAEAEEVDPAYAWSLLDPLDGSCLYHRQIWFTYAYCHNKHIRQFREAPHAHPHPPGGIIPQEDNQYESYTLGQAPSTPPGTDVSLADRARAAHVEIVRGAGPTYLVLRWGDGTVCDKTGRRRDAEIQFHCGMAGPDTVLFIKETRTCSYVLVVHTPRVCSLPGFRAPDADAQAEIKCRQVLDVLPPKGDLGLLAGEEPAPAAIPKKKSPVLAPPQGTENKKAGKKDTMTVGSLSKEKADLFHQLEKILKIGDGEGGVMLQELGDGTYALEIPEDFLEGDWTNGDYDDLGSAAEGYGFAQGDEIELDEDLSARLFDILKAAGHDVKGVTTKDKKKKGKKDEKDEENDI